MLQAISSFLVHSFAFHKLSVIKRLSIAMLLAVTSMSVLAQPEAIPNKPIDAKTAKALDKASEGSNLGQLKTANKELATQNATLEQENNALQTQVNVLAAERSNQLFMTGAFVAIGGIFLGFIAAWLLVGRRSSDW